MNWQIIRQLNRSCNFKWLRNQAFYSTRRIFKNSEIPHDLIKVVFNGEIKAMKLKEAIGSIDQKTHDLILVDSMQTPPICKVVSKKDQYDAKKTKKTHQKTVLKELEINTHIGEGDLKVKLNRAIGFLGKGNNVKITLVDKGEKNIVSMMKDIVQECSDVGAVTGAATKVGKKLIFNINARAGK